MEIKRIVPNISSNRMEESKQFYGKFLGLELATDMEWILTFVSASNHTAQIIVVKKDQAHISNDITITMEVPDIESIYAKVLSAKLSVLFYQKDCSP